MRINLYIKLLFLNLAIVRLSFTFVLFLYHKSIHLHAYTFLLIFFLELLEHEDGKILGV